jgi:hypothetical protein
VVPIFIVCLLPVGSLRKRRYFFNSYQSGINLIVNMRAAPCQGLNPVFALQR